MRIYRSDYNILKETGLTNSEIEEMCRNIHYMIYETDDFTQHILEYMREYECGPDEIRGFVNLIFENHRMDNWDKVDFPDGDSYLVQYII